MNVGGVPSVRESSGQDSQGQEMANAASTPQVPEAVVQEPKSAPAKDVHPGVPPAEGTHEPGEPVQNPESKTPKAKRKYVRKQPYEFTAARQASSKTNLEKANAAPNEKKYKSTEKRKRANRASLQKANAKRKAKRKAEREALRERFKRLFPLFSGGKSQSGEERGAGGGEGGGGRNEAGMCPEINGVVSSPPYSGFTGDLLLQEAADAVGERRGFYHRQARRLARQVMRLLTVATQSEVSTKEEALTLFHQLLEVFVQARVVAKGEKANEDLHRLLLEMLEERYGREVFVDGYPMASVLRKIEVDYRMGMEQEKTEREERRAAREAAGTEEPDGPEEGEETEEETKEGEEAAKPASPPAADLPPAAKPKGKVPPLPRKFEEFLALFSRAFPPPSSVGARAKEGDQVLLRRLAMAVWDSLHILYGQVQKEQDGLRTFEDVGSHPVETHQDLRQRVYAIERAFHTEPSLPPVMQKLQLEIGQEIQQLVRWRYGADHERGVFPPPPRGTVTSTEWPGMDGFEKL
jgi:hypothetical protein